MTNEQAVEMMKAKLECMTREVSGAEKMCNAKKCDECDLCYAQGNMGEQKEWLRMAINALENQKTGKWIGDWFSPKCSVCGKKPLYERYYGVDGEETSLLKSPYCPYCGVKMESEV